MKKILCSLLIVMMVVCFMPTMAFAAGSASVFTETELKDAIAAANGTKDAPTVINVTGEITLSESLTIDGKHIVLQGGGTIKAGTEFTVTSDSMIIVTNEASLTTRNITLNANEQCRVICVGGGAKPEGDNVPKSTLTIEDGTLITKGAPPLNEAGTAEKAMSGGGVYVAWDQAADVYLNGGDITENRCSSNKHGGGMHLGNRPETVFEMTKGTVSNNEGGGIATGGSHVIKGGSIVNNTNGYGISSTDGPIISGNVTLTGNTDKNGNARNLYLGGDSGTAGYFYIGGKLESDIEIATNYYLTSVVVIAKPVEGYTITEADLAHLKVGGVSNDNATLDYPLFLVDNKIQTRANAAIKLVSEEETWKTIRVPANEKYTLPTDVTNGTYTFSYWAESNGTKCTDITPEKGITYTYYAHWVADVTFDANGGTFTDGSRTVTGQTTKGWGISKAEGENEITIPTVDERAHYTLLDGWYTAPTGGEKITTWSGVVPTGATTYYLQWTPDTYTVTLNQNDATTGGTASVTATYESAALSETITNPAKDNLVFRGWTATENGTDVVIDRTGTLKASVAGYTDAEGRWIRTEATTLYAYWTEKGVPSPDETQQVFTYGDQNAAFAVAGTPADKYTIEYKVENTYTETVPTDAGIYDVKLTRAEDDEYEAFAKELEGAFKINPAVPTITLADKAAYYTGSTIEMDGAAVTLKNGETYSGTVNYTYYVTQADAEAGTNAIAAPTAVGTYYVKASIGAAGNYTAAESGIAKFEIQSKPSTGGGYYVSPLTTAKNSATFALNAAAKAEVYEAAEQAQIDAILAQAKADISKATTKAEVEKIQADALAAIDAIPTAAEKKAEAEAAAAKLERIKKGVENTTLKAKSKLIKRDNGKLAIRVDWTKSKGYKVDYYEVHRSVKKNSGYGKKPFFTTSDGDKCYYINTKNVKPGNTYYFYVRGVRILDGEKVYTEKSTKAWRTVKKA